MYCPQCGQERISEATSFCSRCGYLLTGTAELLRTGGAVPAVSGSSSPRARGIKQGLFMFLLMFIVAPIVGMISVFGLGIEPWPVGITVVLLGLGGLLRIIYAFMFESKVPAAVSGVPAGRIPNPIENLATSALPPQRDVPASDYVSPRKGRLEISTEHPSSVVEGTTRLLDKDLE